MLEVDRFFWDQDSLFTTARRERSQDWISFSPSHGSIGEMLLRAQHKKPVQLIKIGEVTSDFTKAVAEAGLVKEVLNLGIIPRSSLPDLYNSVDVLLFPSLYEGFGWPPLEAMACGTPIVASNVASLPEVIDNAGLMCSPLDTDGLADAVNTTTLN